MFSIKSILLSGRVWFASSETLLILFLTHCHSRFGIQGLITVNHGAFDFVLGKAMNSIRSPGLLTGQATHAGVLSSEKPPSNSNMGSTVLRRGKVFDFGSSMHRGERSRSPHERVDEVDDDTFSSSSDSWELIDSPEKPSKSEKQADPAVVDEYDEKKIPLPITSPSKVS